MRGLLLAALTEAAIITWRDLSKQKVLPLPSDYVSVAILYGGLGLLPESAAGTASLIGWGIVVATFLNLPGTSLIYPGQSVQVTGGAGGGTPTSVGQTPRPAVGAPSAPGQAGFGAAIVPVNQQTGVAQ